MDPILEKLVSQLPDLDIELTESNKKKIYRLIPVPTDYRILWADIMSFGGYPAGVVITDRTLIVNAKTLVPTKVMMFCDNKPNTGSYAFAQ